MSLNRYFPLVSRSFELSGSMRLLIWEGINDAFTMHLASCLGYIHCNDHDVCKLGSPSELILRSMKRH